MQMSDMVLLHKTNNLEGEDVWTGAYGPHLLMDANGCDAKTFTRDSIRGFMHKLVEVVEMDAEDFHFWDDYDTPEDDKQTEVHAKGTTIGGIFKKKVGIQFIITSSIVIHTIEELGRVYIDIFSCKLFNEYAASRLVKDWFKALKVRNHLIQRS